MYHDLVNPFAQFGNIIHGPDFIGRKEALEIIESRVVRPLGGGGSLAIVGIPRIGKSSLVYQGLIERKSELHLKKLLPIRIDLALYEQPESFFLALVSSCKQELEELHWDNEAIQISANESLKDNNAWTQRINDIMRFFSKVRQAGIRVIFVLDEFDAARTLFKDSISHIQGVRELAYNPETGVSWVVASRRPINDIEAKTLISTLAGIFLDHYLTVFNEEQDLPLFFARSAEAGLDLTQDHKDIIDSYCGRHPYLLEMLGYHLVKMYTHKDVEIDVAAAFHKVQQKFVDYYDNLIAILREDNDARYKNLLQILFGPIYGLNQNDVTVLMNYGLIRPNPKWTPEQHGVAAYIAFSSHFHEYLHSKIQWVDLWPLLGETEKAMRRVIRLKLPEKYGDGSNEYDEHCLVLMRAAHPKLSDTFEQCKKNRDKDKNGLAPSRDLLDYTYPRDLFTLIFAEWDGLFKSIFGKQPKKNKEYWNDISL
jgi:hypothetical protein